ncbi:MAG: sporulation protein YtxC [Eubacteriales bacterium]|nr:sporulation protein YtxC [Clostridia bacterium]MDZ4044095.1 sporulation protein YtxC [Eubacteriales bacterium]MDZ7610801.1 sporulation protein YtxC [Eubacteriales bacterium]
MEIKVVVDPEHSETFDTFVRRELKILRTRGMRVQYKEKPKGFFRCRMTEHRFFGRVDRKGFTAAIANGVAALVTAQWQAYFGPELVRGQDCTSDDPDWVQLCERLNEDRALMRKLRNMATTRISQHLEECPMVDVEGLARFRLNDLADQLIDALAWLVDDQIFQQENEEFISILKNFTKRREERLDVVNVVIEAGSRFTLYDGSFEDLSQKLEMDAHFLEDEVRNEDLLISSLLTLSPLKIVLHGKRCLPVTLETLREVFGSTITQCSGCEQCAIWNKA